MTVLSLCAALLPGLLPGQPTGPSGAPVGAEHAGPSAEAPAVAPPRVQRGSREANQRGASQRGRQASGGRGSGQRASGTPGAGQEPGAGQTPTRPRANRAGAEQLAEWYAAGDHNQNGWISYSEAHASLGFDRARFQAYDADHDGRLQLEEFEDYYVESLTRAGTFNPPKGARGRRAPRRSHDQLRIAYDFDLDEHLSVAEVTRVLADYDQAALPPERVVRALDSNGDGLLDLAELEGLPTILYPVTLPPRDSPEAQPTTPLTLAELFGRREQRSSNPRASAAPPRIAGPIHPFHRLDLDQDGSISVADLEALLRPIHLRVRLRTIVNTLDRDLDGVLSPAELRDALLPPGKR